MAENNWPASQPTKIDLAKAARARKGTRTPMSSDRLYNVPSLEDTTGRTQLISPPPEETLHLRRASGTIVASAPKRKRNTPQPAEPPQPPEATPNPKPRKQSKHRPISSDSPTRPSHRSPAPPTTPSKSSRVLLSKSPHADNPHADYIPPVPSSTARRAAARRTTPIPAYEPPSDVFTPPRVVVLTPTISKSSKRKSTTKPKPKRTTEPLNLVIKTEPPQIDLSLPMPPPSPTDDPLLLSGPIEPPTSTPVRPRRQLKEAAVCTTPPPAQEEPLPPSSSPGDEDEDEPGLPRFAWAQHNSTAEPEGFTSTTDFSMDVDDSGVQPVALFDFNLPPADGGWSDSDDDQVGGNNHDLPAGAEDEGVGQGEYTGRFRMLRVRTKQDPPSSATKERMEEWGRPITPFPRKKLQRLDLLKEVEEEVEVENRDVAMNEDEEEEQEVREMSLPLADEEEPSVELEQDPLKGQFEVATPAEDAPQPPEDTSVDDDAPSAAALPPDDHDDQDDISHDLEQSFDHSLEAHNDEDEDEEEREVREMSVLEDDAAFDHPDPTSAREDLQEQHRMEPNLAEEHIEAPAARVADTLDDSDASDSDSDLDHGMVKITSTDPRAAARAAAILKQHDYDCFTKITMKQKQRSRHSLGLGDARGVASGGITKARGKARRRTTLGASVSVIGDRVYIPGSPVVTLPELLREAEAQVVAESSPRMTMRTPVAFETPVRRGSDATTVVLGERAWTKEEWKLLDACFTDERLELGGQGMAPVDLVRPENVVARFVQILGGEDVLETFGDAWNMDNLLQRVRALQNKQRSGNVAPPTTPYTPSPSARNHTFAHSRRMLSMEVPDFTPLGRRTAPPARAQRPVFPPPVVENAPFANIPPQKETARPTKRLPMSLLAPRYSHLLEEAVAVSQLSTAIADSSVASAEDDESNIDTDTPTAGEDGALTQEKDAEDAPAPRAPSPSPPPPAPAPAPATLGRRVKGFLFSYLPTLSKTAPPGRQKSSHALPRRPGLPLPPLDVLEKPRGPIATPVRAPAPKTKHPRELVQLHPAPVPEPKPTMIPRAARKPQRMVELHHVSPPREKETEKEKGKGVVPRPRRSSGGSSVKDLVRGFEELDSSRRGQKGSMELKRVRSVGEWRKTAGLGAGAAGGGAGKPTWRP
ncbi:hypothetical protein LshimejAT787_0604340 [Lyophyllum shimeji]|uniref:Uncharacterized protein n=1 Tax=Lyophyllum shimeji TaxID=47721 RepID=A0A9P3PPZ9_LYOSH|nr:hypothetical protein LshimejAT787_0604340 [Lyophyllum shimeji]